MNDDGSAVKDVLRVDIEEVAVDIEKVAVDMKLLNGWDNLLDMNFVVGTEPVEFEVDTEPVEF